MKDQRDCDFIAETKANAAGAIALLGLLSLQRSMKPDELRAVATMAALEICARQLGVAGAVEYFRDVIDVAERQAMEEAGLVPPA